VTAQAKTGQKCTVFGAFVEGVIRAFNVYSMTAGTSDVSRRGGPHPPLFFYGFVSTASAAESLRSRCGSLRGAPVCNSQAFPIAAPHVVQGTDNICFGVSSLVFTMLIMQRSTVRKCSILLISSTLAKRKVVLRRPRLFLQLCAKMNSFRDHDSAMMLWSVIAGEAP
jgi:hypothetical protein